MPNLTDIVLPPDQTEGTTNVVGKWFKAAGEAVRANDPLLEITTDKVTVEIAAAHDGVLLEILKQEGDNVVQGEVLGRLGPSGSVAAESPKPNVDPLSPRATAVATEPELAPAVRRLIKQYGLNVSTIVGTGRGGRITVEDVEAAASQATKPTGGLTGRMVPHSAMRKSVAAHMAASMATAPHVTSVFEADLSTVIAHREANGKRATFTAYFVRAAVLALRAVPEVNSRWHDQGLELFDDCNIGVGVALESGGLIVPVIHGAQSLDLDQTAARLADLTSRARAGGLTAKEVQGGTFTISNHGTSGSLVATPIIINQPQSAILGVGKMAKRVVVGPGDQPVVKPMIYVTLTIDHRVLDGFQANAFLTKWVETIERWA